MASALPTTSVVARFAPNAEAITLVRVTTPSSQPGSLDPCATCPGRDTAVDAWSDLQSASVAGGDGLALDVTRADRRERAMTSKADGAAGRSGGRAPGPGPARATAAEHLSHADRVARGKDA